MITIPEGMGLEAYGLIEDAEGIEGIRRTIKRLRQRKKWKYAATPAEAAKVARSSAQRRKFMKEGYVPAADVQVPEIEIEEKASKTDYARVREFEDSIDEPPEEVRVVGYNRITPVRSSKDIVPVTARVVEPTPEPVDEGEGVDIIPEEGEIFYADIERREVPGLPDDEPEPQMMPRMIEIEAPDKMIYRGSRRSRPSEKIEEEAHDEIEEAPEEMAGVRVPDDTPLDDLNQVETIIAAVVGAAAASFQAYSTIKASREATKREKIAASSASAAASAEFENQFSANLAQKVAAGGPTVIQAPGQAPLLVQSADQARLAPLSSASPFPWKYVIPIGVGVIGLGAIAVLYFKR